MCTHDAVDSLATHKPSTTCDITKRVYYVCKQLLMQQNVDILRLMDVYDYL